MEDKVKQTRQEIAKLLVQRKVTIETIAIGAKSGGTSRATLITER
jgi:hypothetical protein